MTEIDVAATMKQKLDVDMPPYKILGACNPQFANRAIGAEPQIGALLPCNVVVRQDMEGKILVEFMDPIAVMDLVGKPEVRPPASEVRQRLERMLRAIGARRSFWIGSIGGGRVKARRLAWCP